MKSMTIYCPDCKRKVAVWDGKQESNIITGCRKCKKKIVYNPITKELKTSKIPQRQDSSGVRFYY